MNPTTPRLFCCLAALDGLLLMTSFGSRPAGTFGLSGRLGPWAFGLTLAVHAVALAYLVASAARVTRLARSAGLPAWLAHQGVKNVRKGLVFAAWASALTATAAALGSPEAPGSGIGSRSLLALGVSALALSFNLGAFAVELAVIGAQARLARETAAGAALRRSHRREAAGVSVR